MQKKHILRILIIVGLLLLIPVYGNCFISGWNWGLEDFIFATVFFLIAGTALQLAWNKINDTTYKVSAVVVILILFTLLWVDLAVGIFNIPGFSGN